MHPDFKKLFREFIMDLYPKVYNVIDDCPEERQSLLDEVNKTIEETEKFLNSMKEQQAVLAIHR